MAEGRPDILSLIIDRACATPAVIRQVWVGLTWTGCQVEIDGQTSTGFAMTPREHTRTLPWSGTLRGRPLHDVVPWLATGNGFERSVALAAANAVINRVQNPLLASALDIHHTHGGNLSVFSCLKPKLARRKTVIIGRYPGLDAVMQGLDYVVLELDPGPGDLPASAAPEVLPGADWVFLTATSLLNGSFTELCDLALEAVTVLMGPTCPWLHEFAGRGIDFLAGVRVQDPDFAAQVVVEGGGTRLFDGGVSYALADLSAPRLGKLRTDIARVFTQRKTLVAAMDDWYRQGRKGGFPQRRELESTEHELSRLDTAYKRLWDATHPTLPRPSHDTLHPPQTPVPLA